MERRPPAHTADGRVAVRELEPGDLDAYHEMHADPGVLRHLPLSVHDRDAAARSLRNRLSERRRRPRQGWTLAVVEADDPELAGVIRLGLDAADHRRYEVGFMVRRSRWGRGLASGALSLVLDLAFDELGAHRVWAVRAPDNPASARVLERCGMVEEGRLRHDLRVRGRWVDSVVHAVIAPDRPVR
jgi:[ribosomal protein S5]-alanine N-acetyltransferase